jgi:hypothetical protein
MYFHGLITHFFLVLNSILLSEDTAVYLSVHPMKQLLDNICRAAINIHVQFSVCLGKYQGL